MKTEVSFWDTSVIVPLLCQQDTSGGLRRLWRTQKRIVVWWGTSLEAISAVNRLKAEKLLGEKQFRKALANLETVRRQWREIAPVENVRVTAETLPQLHNLRALDSFQLAAALVWSQHKPKNRLFVCADGRLAEAARNSGFSVQL